MAVQRGNENVGHSVPTVLIVDDEPAIREIYALHLRKEFAVQTAADGDVSLARIREQIDIVFLDRHMPGTNGDELLRRMRSNGLETPVIFISAVDADETPEASYQAYLSKPISGAELKHHVDRYTHADVGQPAE